MWLNVPVDGHLRSMDVCKLFGSNVRRIRRAKDISQEELADRADIHRTYLSALERAGDRNPTLRVMDRLAAALDVPLASLLEEPVS
jgi:transcriptional regulator with XRE-family HTH domain